MSSLQFSGRIRDNVSVPVQQGQFTPSDGGRPQRKLSHQRKYEVAALMSDLSIETKQVVAPATSVFEDTASAFARGTIIPTVSGPVAVEDLIPGDFVETEHGPEPVVWIGSTSYVPNIEGTGSSLTGLYPATPVPMAITARSPTRCSALPPVSATSAPICAR
jgi:hypothetical protein